MFYIFYNSYSAKDFRDGDLMELLAAAREKNARLGITGMLFYFERQFLQLIEGNEATVRQLNKEIAADTRHRHFLVLQKGETASRFFADWSMGFKSISPENFEDVKNFKELNQAGAEGRAPFIYLMKILAERL